MCLNFHLMFREYLAPLYICYFRISLPSASTDFSISSIFCLSSSMSFFVQSNTHSNILLVKITFSLKESSESESVHVYNDHQRYLIILGNDPLTYSHQYLTITPSWMKTVSSTPYLKMTFIFFLSFFGFSGHTRKWCSWVTPG